MSPDPSATVVLLRAGPSALELLLLRRSAKLVFHGGAWVFPGGRIDPEDYAAGAEHDVVAASRKGAVREIHEETGLCVDPMDLVPSSRWTTPEGLPRRFATWFYAAATHVRHHFRALGLRQLAGGALESARARARELLPARAGRGGWRLLSVPGRRRLCRERSRKAGSASPSVAAGYGLALRTLFLSLSPHRSAARRECRSLAVCKSPQQPTSVASGSSV